MKNQIYIICFDYCIQVKIRKILLSTILISFTMFYLLSFCTPAFKYAVYKIRIVFSYFLLNICMNFINCCKFRYQFNFRLQQKKSKFMSQNVKVMVRCRPFVAKQDSKSNILLIDNDLHQITVSKPKCSAQYQKVFTFDHVFGPESSQQQIYEQSAFMLVQNVLQGYNGTIFAYGQTGCGKTYTMTGGYSQQQKGVIPRTFKQIITRTSSQKQKRHLLHCSYIQIYNEQVYDLFDKKNRTKLEVKQVPGKGTIIKDQKLQIIKTQQQMYKLFQMGSKNRAIRQTSFNKYSSRSHCIFTLYIQSVQQTIDGNQLYKSGKLNLVDLAGSQRQSKIKMAGLGLKQTTRINLSLSALGNVISALVDGKSSHIPYRDSKLTRLLQDSLGGNTQTVMIATISPSQSSYEQTLSTLRYASRTKFIKNKPIVNEDPKDTLLRQYAQQIKRLKTILDGISPDLFINGGMVQKQENSNNLYETQRILDQQQKQQLKRKLDALEKLLQKQQVEQDASQLQKINRLKQKLKEQQWKQQQYLQDKKKRQQQLMSLQTNYKSLNDEVDLLRQRFQELKTKYMQSQQQIKDLRHEYQRQKQQLLSTIRTQQADLSKYRGIVEIAMTEKQIQQIVNKSKLNQQEMTWQITPFLLKQNMLIFPQSTIRSFGDILKKEKQKINMFVSQTSRKDYVQRQRTDSIGRISSQRNTKQSFAFSDNTARKRNVSLNNLAEPRTSKNSIVSKTQRMASNHSKKYLVPVEEKKKLNIDIGKIKMDILAELQRNKIRKNT